MASVQTERFRAAESQQIQELRNKIIGLEKVLADSRQAIAHVQVLEGLSHADALLPFAPAFYCHGKVFGSREILVALGDKWFVQRSRRQAQHILERRINAMERSLAEQRAALRNMEERAAPELVYQELIHERDREGIVEIKEEYVEEEDDRSQQAEKDACSEEVGHVSQGRDDDDDEVLFRRLEQLERLEAESEGHIKATIRSPSDIFETMAATQAGRKLNRQREGKPEQAADAETQRFRTRPPKLAGEPIVVLGGGQLAETLHPPDPRALQAPRVAMRAPVGHENDSAELRKRPPAPEAIVRGAQVPPRIQGHSGTQQRPPQRVSRFKQLMIERRNAEH